MPGIALCDALESHDAPFEGPILFKSSKAILRTGWVKAALPLRERAKRPLVKLDKSHKKILHNDGLFNHR